MKISRKVSRTLGPYYRTMEMIHDPSMMEKARKKIKWFYETKVEPEEDRDLSILYHMLYVNLVLSDMLSVQGFLNTKKTVKYK